jgi:hypothetical protein
MADDDVTAGTIGSGALLALEPSTIENSGLISKIDEDSNHSPSLSPLLGTSLSQDIDNTGDRRQDGPLSVSVTQGSYTIAAAILGKHWKDGRKSDRSRCSDQGRSNAAADLRSAT